MVEGVGASGWDIFHLNFSTMFLNGKLQQIVHMFQQLGYTIPGFKRLVCKLPKAMCRLSTKSIQSQETFHETFFDGNL